MEKFNHFIFTTQCRSDDRTICSRFKKRLAHDGTTNFYSLATLYSIRAFCHCPYFNEYRSANHFNWLNLYNQKFILKTCPVQKLTKKHITTKTLLYNFCMGC